MYSHQEFVDCVLSNSESEYLSSALEEWNIVSNFHERESECFCGHVITDVYSLRNIKNGNILPYVGSKCVKRFGPKMETRLLRFKQGSRIVKKGKMQGKSYDEICRDQFEYVRWLIKTGSTKREHKAIIDYARWLFAS